MHLSHATFYGLKLSLSQAIASSPLVRRNSTDRTMTSAFFLATVGLSLSMFSLKQMFSSSAHQHRQRRHH